MKFPISNFQFPISRGEGKLAAPRRCQIGNWQLVIGNARSGMALVISLIMLSVTLVMAVAFLALSRRERAAVTTTTDTATARLAAESALAAAQAQIAANIWTTNTAAANFGLLVSTNYQNALGYNPNGGPNGFGPDNPTNVNYDYTLAGNSLSAGQLIQNIANLWFLPRVPVFIPTNQAPYGYDFRFFLDLNRNGRFEANGRQPQIGPNNGYLHLDGTEGLGLVDVVTNRMTGDPEWIGVLERPDQPHGPNNKFVSRYAFFAQPIGNSLDLNYIHNQVFNTGLAAADGYFRNQAAGSWEMNLAAFLADLNTNEWNPPLANYYQYNQALSGFANSGYSFEDARAMLSWRYGYNYNNLATANNYFANAANVFPSDNIDNYGDGPLQTGIPGVNEAIIANQDKPNLPWPGAENLNRFFALPSDLFDATKSSTAFVNRLQGAGSGNATYDRYTFYRLLEQLGTDSKADDDRMNLNYKNIVDGWVVPGMETNQIPWTAIDFFTNAADRLLRYQTARWRQENYRDFTNTFGAANTAAFGVDRIPVYVQGRLVYTPTVNRLLQLAANLYDASTNRAALLGKDYPHVFRPVFTATNSGAYRDIYIIGYAEVASANPATISTDPSNPLFTPFRLPEDLNAFALNVANYVNIYGVPWIIGAKKNFPAFNQFYMLNAVLAERKVAVSKPFFGASQDLFTTNQMYLFSISNSFGCSFWNPYTNSYTNAYVVARGELTMIITNETGQALAQFIRAPYAGGFATALWPGTIWQSAPPAKDLSVNNRSILTPLRLTSVLLTNSIYRYAGYSPSYAGGVLVPSPGFDPFNTDYQRLGPNVSFTPAMPRLGLQTTNRLQAFILDGNTVIDYVSFSGPEGSRDLSAELADSGINNGQRGVYIWSTNQMSAGSAYPNNTPWGVPNQIAVSLGYADPIINGNGGGGKFWQAPPNYPSYLPKNQQAEMACFQGFYNVNSLKYGTFDVNGKHYTNTLLSMQAPYTPQRMLYSYVNWQANDPLVHYLASDLNYDDPGNTGIQKSDDPDNFLPRIDLNAVPQRWSPWGVNYPIFASSSRNYVDGTWQTALKDSLVWRPDDWDFPTGKFPSAGWLGRVHRGTPWQTVYFKATDIANINGNIGINSWKQWTGNTATTVLGHNFDSAHSAPVADSALFDLFTTRLNDNAARGALSVNTGAGQADGGLAAWSALFSGVVALTNSGPNRVGYVASPPATFTIISPAGADGTNSPVGQIVESIKNTRAAFVNLDGVKGTFERVGDVLRVPLLTEQSPFLHRLDGGVTNVNQLKYAISDQLYEWLPQQIVGLLRVNPTPRYVIYCYGQALRPAPESFVTDTANFGLCTNYQVVAESAARAVVRVDRQVVNGTTNYTSTVESYNVLPPD